MVLAIVSLGTRGHMMDMLDFRAFLDPRLLVGHLLSLLDS